MFKDASPSLSDVGAQGQGEAAGEVVVSAVSTNTFSKLSISLSSQSEKENMHRPLSGYEHMTCRLNSPYKAAVHLTKDRQVMSQLWLYFSMWPATFTILNSPFPSSLCLFLSLSANTYSQRLLTLKIFLSRRHINSCQHTYTLQHTVTQNKGEVCTPLYAHPKRWGDRPPSDILNIEVEKAQLKALLSHKEKVCA
jgi:hypothetical protein